MSVHPLIPVPPEDRHIIHNRNGSVVGHHLGRVIVWGGEHNGTRDFLGINDGGERGWRPEDIHYLNTSDHTWYYQQATGDDLPRQTCYAAAATIGDRLYVIGGSISEAEFDEIRGNAPEGETLSATRTRAQESSNDVHLLDLRNWTWTRLEPEGDRKPLKSSEMSAWFAGGSIFVFGGLGEIGPANWDNHNDLSAYDTVRNVWWWPECSGQAPSPRCGHASFVDVETNRAYVFGGLFQGTSSELFVLDMTSWRWEEMVNEGTDDDVPCCRVGHTLTLLSSSSSSLIALLYGGKVARWDVGTFLGDCWRLHISSGRYCWSRCFQLERGPRWLHGATLVPKTGELFLVGGCLDFATWSGAGQVIKIPVAVSTLKHLAMTILVEEKEIVQSTVRRFGPPSVQALFDAFLKLRLEEEEEKHMEMTKMDKIKRGELSVMHT